MSTEPHVPSEASFLAAYRSAAARLADSPNFAETAVEARRGIAKIRADALREFGRSLIKDSDPETDQRVFDPWDVDSLATNRADRIEEEA